MNLKLFVRGLDDASTLREYARDKVSAGLQRHARRLLRVMVRLEDETGPRKRKVDKICSIDVVLSSGEIRVRERGKDILQVLDTALDRMRAALGRQISRRKRGVGEG